MFNFLLDIVSDDGQADGGTNSARILTEYLSKHGSTLLFVLITGILIGIFVSYVFCKIKIFFTSNYHEEKNNNENTDKEGE